MPVVEVEVDGADAELAADALWQAGPTAVSEVALGGGRVRLVADVTDVGRIDRRWGARVVEPDHDAHLDAWRSWAQPLRVGRRLVLQPAWVEAPAAGPDDIVVVLDPGRAFGSGSHVSTQLVLAALEDMIHGGERVLDVGCGSGVLSVAACRLGADTAVGVDIDPDALEATRANAKANGVAAAIEVVADLEQVDGDFDVVLANIGARVLRDLAPALIGRLRPSGRVVLAGLLAAQADEVGAAYADLDGVSRLGREGWVALVLVSPPGA